MTKHAIIYDRASTKMQEDNWSRVNAKEVGIRVAEQNGYSWEYVKEIGSGTTLTGRPKMLAILDRIAAGEVQIIIVQDLDRLARPIERAVYETIRNMCLENDVIVHTHSGSFDFADDDSDFVADINMAVSKKEARRIRKRTRRGRVAKAEAGGFLGGSVPLGYKTVHVENNGKSVSDLAIDEDEKELVKVIFDTLENMGGNIGGAAIHLNEMGYVGKTGCSFVPNTLRGIANRQLYIGLVSSFYTDKVIYRAELQIINVKQFERVNKLIESRKKGKNEAGNRGRYPFTGLVVCGTCGGLMVAANYRKRGFVLYTCHNRRTYGKTVCSKGKSYNQGLITDAVTTFLANFLQDQIDLKAMLDRAADEHGKTITEQAHEAVVMGELNAVKQEKERVIDFIGKGILTEDEAQKKLEKLREEEQNLTREIAGIREKTAIRDDYLRAIESLKNVDIKAELMAMAELEPVTFRRFLRLIFKPNSLKVRTEKAGRNWQAVIEGYEFTEAVLKEVSHVPSFCSNEGLLLQ